MPCFMLTRRLARLNTPLEERETSVGGRAWIPHTPHQLGQLIWQRALAEVQWRHTVVSDRPRQEGANDLQGVRSTHKGTLQGTPDTTHLCSIWCIQGQVLQVSQESIEGCK